VVLVAATSADQGSEIAVDSLDHAEGDLVFAVGKDAVEVAEQSARQLLEGRESLPAERGQPVSQEGHGGPFVGIAPEPLDLLLEVVGLEEAAVEGEGLLELSSWPP
jgi:hypothetical protein